MYAPRFHVVEVNTPKSSCELADVACAYKTYGACKGHLAGEATKHCNRLGYVFERVCIFMPSRREERRGKENQFFENS